MLVKIYHKTDQLISSEISKKLAKLINNKYQVIIDYEKVPSSCEPFILISVGGDGTLINAVHHHINKLDQVYFLSINTGKLGFYCDYSIDQIHLLAKNLNDSHDQIKNQQQEIEKIHLISGKYKNQVYFALNEIVITQLARTIVGRVKINDDVLERFKGTGILCATPTGSCGYNKSLHGSIVMPQINGMIYNEIAPCVNKSQKTLATGLVLHRNSEVEFEFDKNKHNNECLLIHDSRVVPLDIWKNNIITIKYSKKYIKYLILKKHHYNFIDRIKKSFIE